MRLPTSSPAASRFYVADFGRRAVTSPAAAGGRCRATLGPVPDGELWLIERMVVSCTSTTPTTALVYVDTVDPTRLVDGTASGNLDVADSNSPLQVDTGSTLLVEWSSASTGAVGTFRAQWTVMRRDG